MPRSRFGHVMYLVALWMPLIAVVWLVVGKYVVGGQAGLLTLALWMFLAPFVLVNVATTVVLLGRELRRRSWLGVPAAVVTLIALIVVFATAFTGDYDDGGITYLPFGMTSERTNVEIRSSDLTLGLVFAYAAASLVLLCLAIAARIGARNAVRAAPQATN